MKTNENGITAEEEIKLYDEYKASLEGSYIKIYFDKDIEGANGMEQILEIQEIVNMKVTVALEGNCSLNSFNDSYDVYNFNYDLDKNLKSFNAQAVDKKKIKVIYVKSKGLQNADGTTVSSFDITSKCYEEKLKDLYGHEGNEEFKNFIKLGTSLIKDGSINRFHIIPYKVGNIVKELLSIEGVGTVFGKGFGNPEIKNATEDNIEVIKGLLDINAKLGFLKPRSHEYLINNHSNFKLAYIDSIAVGCVEIITINEDTVELGALSVIPSYLSYKIGLKLIKSVEEMAMKNGKTIISVTNNPKLVAIYEKNGYKLDTEGKYEFRLKKSPGKMLFYK